MDGNKGTGLLSLLIEGYLRLRRALDHRFLNRALMSAYGGIHPKNIFNYRWEFFAENVGPEDVVLDVGCGTGLILSKVSPLIRKGYGLDHDPDLPKYLARFPHSGNIEPIVADFHAFDFPAFRRRTGYNVCIASHVLEHIKDVPALLRRIDAPRLLICVPSQENWRTQLMVNLKLPYHTDPGHFREYTQDMLRKELETAGYRVASMGFNSEGEIVCRAERVEGSSS